MRGKKISAYAAILIIVIAGSLATAMIVDAGTAVPDSYVSMDPFDINANFTRE